MINLEEDFRSLYANNPERAILQLLGTQKEALALMVQGYHSREKVRHVNFIADSLKLEAGGKGSLIASYQLEEFSVCAAIDDTAMESMSLTFSMMDDNKTIKVSGVYIPEREPDSF